MEKNLVITIAPRSIVLALSIILGLFLIARIPDIIAILLVSLILAAALAPGVAYFEHRLRLKRPFAILLIYGLVLCAFGLLGLIIVPVLVDQAFQLFGSLPSYAGLARVTLDRLQGYGLRIPPMSDLFRLVSQQGTIWLRSSLSYTFQAISVMLSAFGVIATTFFLLNDGPNLKRGLLRLLPPSQREKFAGLFGPVALQLGAYVRGQLAVISCFTLYLAVALSVARVPYALVLAMIAGLLDIIPMVGTLAVVPAALIALTVSWKLAVIVLIIFMIGNFLEGNVLSPLIISKSVNIPPVLIFFALMIGASFMGILGALIAVPVTAAILVLVEHLYLPLVEPQGEAEQTK